VIQSILFFVLGFLCAGFIAVLVAPAAWRRAVRLTRKRIESSMALTPNEFQAEKDALRAEYAMSIRRLEMSGDAVRRKLNEQSVEFNRARQEIKVLTVERDEQARTILSLETQLGALGADFRKGQTEVQPLLDKLAELTEKNEAGASELERLSRLYEETAYLSSSRQIELVARESDVDKLTSEVLQLRTQRKEAEARAQAAAVEAKAVREELTDEKARVRELVDKIEGLIGTIADREERLERLGRELARSRGTAGMDTQDGATLSGTGEELAPLMTDTEIGRALASLSADRDRLEARLSALAKENERLRAQGAAASASHDEDTRLREQMSDLAAEVVHLISLVEGPDSPALKALDEEQGGGNEDNQAGPSLADRIRALRRAASIG
jgi:chromosome segregation ATPase